MKNDEELSFVESLVKEWPKPWVLRSETKEFTFGMISPMTVSNREGKSPENKIPGRILVGKKIAFPTRKYAEWIAKHFFKTAQSRQ